MKAARRWCGAAVVRGGNLRAAGTVDIAVVGGGLTTAVAINGASLIQADATGGGVLTAAQPGLVRLATDRDMRIDGTVAASDSGADVTLTADGMALINGYLYAADQLSVTGGSGAGGNGVVTTSMVWGVDGQGQEVRLGGGLLEAGGGGSPSRGAATWCWGATWAN